MIESCENEIHLEGARKLINLFFKRYSTEKKHRLGFTVFTTDEMVGKMYERLLQAHTLKMRQL